MTMMPSSSMQPDPSLQSVPAPVPVDPSLMQGAPVQSVSPVVDDVKEMETRDELEVQLMSAAIKMCLSACMASEGATAADAEKYAAAAQHFTQSAVLLAPQEAVDDADAQGQIPSAAAKAQILNTTTRGVRRTAGS